MRLARVAILIALNCLIFILGYGNVRYSAQRSMIPVAVEGVVTGLETRKEKHPGKDDVYLVRVEGGKGDISIRQVDELVYQELNVGDQIFKLAGQRSLVINQSSLPLRFSEDFWGMVYAMPMAVVLGLATSAWIMLQCRQRQEVGSAGEPGSRTEEVRSEPNASKTR